MKRIAGLLVAVALLGFALPAAADTGSPTAVDDHVASDDKTVHIRVLDNDSGDFDPSTLAIVSAPAHGSAAVIAHGSPRIKYTAFTAEAGNDTLVYQICNSAGDCATATVYLNFPATTTTTTSATTSTTTAATATSSTAPPDTTTTTTATAPSAAEVTGTTMPPSEPVAVAETTGPRVSRLGEMTLAFHDAGFSAETTVGEPRDIDLAEDFRYLGHSGRDTLKLVAIPALMVSGLVGFLLVGLPQNAVGAFLGFLVGFRRRRKNKHPDAAEQPPESEHP